MNIKRLRVLANIIIVVFIFSVVSCSTNNSYTKKNNEPYIDLATLRIVDSGSDFSEYIGRTILLKGKVVQKLDMTNYYDDKVVEAYEFKSDIDGPIVVIEFKEAVNLVVGDLVEVEGYFAGKIEAKNENGEKTKQVVIDVVNYEPIVSDEVFSLNTLDTTPLLKKELYQSNEVERCRLEVGIMKFYDSYTLMGITFNNYNDNKIKLEELVVEVLENGQVIETKNVKYLSDTLSKTDIGINKEVHLKKINYKNNITIKATAKIQLNGEEKVVEVNSSIN